MPGSTCSEPSPTRLSARMVFTIISRFLSTHDWRFFFILCLSVPHKVFDVIIVVRDLYSS